MVDDVDPSELDLDFFGFNFEQLQQYKKFNKYIEKHVSPLEASMLQWDLGDPVTKQGLPNGILIAFGSMSWWMVVNRQIADDHPGKFDHLKLRYKADKETYKRTIVGLLKQIQTFATGRALLDQFNAGRPSFTRIRPYNLGGSNAETIAAAIEDQQYTIAPGTRLSYDPKDHELYKVIGKGGGANCNVFFSTDAIAPLRQKIRKAHHGHAPAMAPDEVLYHELVHASRMIAGVQNITPADHWYKNAEEYLAVILSNIYISDKGGVAFRAFYDEPPKGYKGKDPPPDDVLWDAAIFLDNPQNTHPSPVEIIDRFRLSQPDFYWKLAHLPPAGAGGWVRKYNWVYWYDQRRNAKTSSRAPVK
jgi:hypothetical protein